MRGPTKQLTTRRLPSWRRALRRTSSSSMLRRRSGRRDRRQSKGSPFHPSRNNKNAARVGHPNIQREGFDQAWLGRGPFCVGGIVIEWDRLVASAASTQQTYTGVVRNR